MSCAALTSQDGFVLESSLTPRAALRILQDNNNSPQRAYAIRQLKRSAQNGDEFALRNLAAAYHRGRLGLAPDLQKAAEYYSQLAEIGNESGALSLARLYNRPDSELYDPDRAFALYEELAANGNDTAQMSVARRLLDERQAPTDRDKAIRILEDLTSRGNEQARVTLAEQLSAPGADADAAFSLLEPLDSQRARRAQARILLDPATEPFDPAQAVTIFEELIAEGDDTALQILAGAYNASGSAITDYDQAARLYAQLVQDAQTSARRNLAARGLALLLLRPDRGPNDPAQGEALLEELSLLGYQPGKRSLAQEYLNSSRPPFNPNRGIELLQELIAEGDASAMLLLGQVYQQGNSVPVSLSRANELFEQGAIAGHQDAMARWGRALYTGDGVTADPEAGLEWLMRGVDNGSVTAHVFLAREAPAEYASHVQRALTRAGFYTGPITAQDDPNTRSAYQLYCTSRGIGEECKAGLFDFASIRAFAISQR